MIKRSAALFLGSVLAIVISMFWLDAPVAALFGARYHVIALETLLSGIVLIAIELLVLGVLFLAARLSGRTGNLSRTLTLACGASILAYGFNHLLKILFGRPVPLAAARLPELPVFHLFQGDNHSSFPSGHMALLGAFAGILWQAYPAARPLVPLALCLAAAAMVIGNWHYVSDTFAGAALGLFAGLVAARFAPTAGR
jgi:membrane-associated phospholipid phosphatase